MRVFAGVDIGGSHVSVGFVDNYGNLLTQTECDIDNFVIKPDELIKVISNLIVASQLKDWKLVSVGIGCPGQSKDNILVAASNLPNFKNVPLASLVSKKLYNVPTILLNDADAAICAEVWSNETKDFYSKSKNIVMMTLGTGIGCGLILEGQLYRGSNGLIEGGHMIVSTQTHNNRKCGCGQTGCVEVFASAKNTAVRLQELDDADNETKKNKTSEGSMSSVTGSKEVFDRYALNDFNAVKIVEETAEHLAFMCINISRLLDPDVIIFSGGMSKAGEVLLDLVRKNIARYSWTVLPNYAELCVARSITAGGMMGAALAGKRMVESNSHGSYAVVPVAVTAVSSRDFLGSLLTYGSGALLSLAGLYLLRNGSDSSHSNSGVGSVVSSVKYLQWFQLVSAVGLGLYTALYTTNNNNTNSDSRRE